MPVRQIEVNWTPPSGIQTASVLHFWDGVSLTTQRSRLGIFLDAVSQFLTDTTSWAIALSGKVLDEATGQMTSIWTSGDAITGAGELAEEPVADSTQVLVQWNTPVIRAGRFVLGRTFIPGLSVGGLTGGNLAVAPQGIITAAASDFASANTGFGVYSRPRPGTPGMIATINSSGVSPELAVLRRRRNRT